MDKIRAAAVILLSMGEKHAAEILKNMNPHEVQVIFEKINEIENVSEKDVIKSLNEFFKEANNNIGIDKITKESMRNSLVSQTSKRGIEGVNVNKLKWVEFVKYESPETIVEFIQDEHPQIITSIILIISHQSSEKASQITKALPKELKSIVMNKMTNMSPIASFAIDALSQFFEEKMKNSEKYEAITVDGVQAVANIVSFMDSESEGEILTNLSNTNKELSEKIQDKLFPFERLGELDNKSMQVLISEVNNDDLVVALKGVDEYVRTNIMKGMSSKSAEILKDEIESKGPVKLAKVVEAQKNIVIIAKRLAKEEKIILTKSNDTDIVY